MNASHTCTTTSRWLNLFTAATAVFAVGAAHASQPARTVEIDCRHRYVTQQNAARLFGTSNFSQTYAKREGLYVDLARACIGHRRAILLPATEVTSKPIAARR
ncbi:MAG: hypothetical protein ABJA62_01390 [Luteimonas sp.]